MKKFNIALILANILLIVSLLVFARGFFPHKAFLPGLAGWHPDHHELSQEAPFDKVIFMVIDALRSDFVFGPESHFNFTRGLIEQGSAVPFTGHASPPTITQPRVKGITTGSLPSFVDLILNFAEGEETSTLAHQDTWLAQIRAKEGGGKLVFYGDDTWLKLFPGFFERADGTSSFFVSDFTEVDNNVTRHIPEELARDDWDGMIMHFLGLDHIGHKAGPQSPNMPYKQREMDGIVRQIYEALMEQPHLKSTLLVLCGDHGMNDGGNHGGSSDGETSTALVFLSPKFKDYFTGVTHPTILAEDFRYHQFVQQSDIAPTLAALLGLPIPLNNLGAIIPDFLKMWKSVDSTISLVLNNVWQLLAVTQATFPGATLVPMSRGQYGTACSKSDISDIDDMRCEYTRLTFSLEDYHAWNIGTDTVLDNASQVLRKAQDIMKSAATNYDLEKMIAGVGLSALATILASISCYTAISKCSLANIMFLLTSILHGILMFASSYVEEEQQFWYWMTSAWLFIQHYVKELQREKSASVSRFIMRGLRSLMIPMLFRITRRWNQTGQKYSGSPDIATTFFRQHPGMLWIFIVITYTYTCLRLSGTTQLRSHSTISKSSFTVSLLSILTCLISFIFKTCFTFADAPELFIGVPFLHHLTSINDSISLTTLARLTFLGLSLLILYHLILHLRPLRVPTSPKTLHSLHNILTLFLLTQSRATNIPLYLIFTLQLDLLLSQIPPLSTTATTPSFPILQTTTTTTLLLHSSFFALGQSNSISSIDLSNAYNGISSYNILAVGILTFVSNWAGPIWWISAGNLLLQKSHNSQTKLGKQTTTIFAIRTWQICFSTLAVMSACLVLREHLFIWTVFSPKYLFQAAWWGFHVFGAVVVGVGGVALG